MRSFFPELPAGRELQPALEGMGIRLPRRADAPMRLELGAVHLEISSEPSSDTPAEIIDGVLFLGPDRILALPAALQDGAAPDELRVASRVEEYFLHSAASGRWHRRYSLHFDGAVTELRELGDHLEILGATGELILRMHYPEARDADGRVRQGELRVEEDLGVGASLVLHASLDLDGLTPPVVIDPGWSFGGAMARGRARHAALRLEDGRVLVVGGVDSRLLPVDTAELYDPRLRSWRTVATLPVSPSGHWALSALPGGRALAQSREHAFIWEPLQEGFVALPAPPPLEQVSMSALKDGRVLLVGAGAPASVFVPSEGRFEPLASQPSVNRIEHSATLLPATGEVLFLGGSRASGQGAVASAEIFDPRNDSFRSLPPMLSARAKHAVAPLPDGRVLVTGGDASGLSAEIFDPNSGTSVRVDDMARARAEHEVVALEDGRVLVVGGFGIDGGASASAEIFAPAGEGGHFSEADSLLAPRAAFSLTSLSDGEGWLAAGGWRAFGDASANSERGLTDAGAPCDLEGFSVTASMDATLAAQQPSAELSDSPQLRLVRWGAGYSQRAVARFDLSGLPEDGRVESAKLRLEITSNALCTGGALEGRLEVSPITADFDAPTWLSRGSGGPWSEPGAGGGDAEISQVIDCYDAGAIEIDLSDVFAVMSGPLPEALGLRLGLADEATGFGQTLVLRSSEAGAGAPVLELEMARAENGCPCTPLGCDAHTPPCGTVADGCGGTLDCGPCPALCEAQAQTLSEGADATLRAEATSVSGAGEPTLELRRWLPRFRRRALLRFDLPALAPGDEVLTARLELPVAHNALCAGGSLEDVVELRRVTREWSEASWSFADEGTPWDTPGGDAEGELAASARVGCHDTVLQLDMQPDIQAFADGASAHHGWLLQLANDATGHGQSVAFGGTLHPDPQLRPRLWLSVRPHASDCGCVPTTCAAQGAECGGIASGCGGVLSCGDCPAPQQCEDNLCVCTPTDCEREGAECGDIDDGCGEALSCGDCTAPESCIENACVCTPTNCPTEGAECGAIASGCGGVLDCGNCAAPSTCVDNACVCTPTTCAAQGAACGDIPDRCGGTLSCGGCAAPENCVDNACVCVPTTCAAQGALCGDIADGCGGVLSCGVCTAPQSCVGNACACVPTTCAARGATCGDIADGCGGVLSCGVCTAPESCVDNACVCTPTTCAAQGAECGDIADGCGGTLSCGACAAPDVCIANTCECTPTTCAAQSAECGPLDNGCGAVLDCGLCNAPDTCSDNSCACIPRTCDDAGAKCGEIDDGCGDPLNCGSCPGGAICGAELPNQCPEPPEPACPPAAEWPVTAQVVGANGAPSVLSPAGAWPQASPLRHAPWDSVSLAAGYETVLDAVPGAGLSQAACDTGRSCTPTGCSPVCGDLTCGLAYQPFLDNDPQPGFPVADHFLDRVMGVTTGDIAHLAFTEARQALDFSGRRFYESRIVSMQAGAQGLASLRNEALALDDALVASLEVPCEVEVRGLIVEDLLVTERDHALELVVAARLIFAVPDPLFPPDPFFTPMIRYDVPLLAGLDPDDLSLRWVVRMQLPDRCDEGRCEEIDRQPVPESALGFPLQQRSRLRVQIAPDGSFLLLHSAEWSHRQLSRFESLLYRATVPEPGASGIPVGLAALLPFNRDDPNENRPYDFALDDAGRIYTVGSASPGAGLEQCGPEVQPLEAELRVYDPSGAFLLRNELGVVYERSPLLNSIDNNTGALSFEGRLLIDEAIEGGKTVYRAAVLGRTPLPAGDCADRLRFYSRDPRLFSDNDDDPLACPERFRADCEIEFPPGAPDRDVFPARCPCRSCEPSFRYLLPQPDQSCENVHALETHRFELQGATLVGADAPPAREVMPVEPGWLTLDHINQRFFHRSRVALDDAGTLLVGAGDDESGLRRFELRGDGITRSWRLPRQPARDLLVGDGHFAVAGEEQILSGLLAGRGHFESQWQSRVRQRGGSILPFDDGSLLMLRGEGQGSETLEMWLLRPTDDRAFGDRRIEALEALPEMPLLSTCNPGEACTPAAIGNVDGTALPGGPPELRCEASSFVPRGADPQTACADILSGAACAFTYRDLDGQQQPWTAAEEWAFRHVSGVVRSFETDGGCAEVGPGGHSRCTPWASCVAGEQFVPYASELLREDSSEPTRVTGCRGETRYSCSQWEELLYPATTPSVSEDYVQLVHIPETGRCDDLGLARATEGVVIRPVPYRIEIVGAQPEDSPEVDLDGEVQLRVSNPEGRVRFTIVGGRAFIGDDPTSNEIAAGDSIALDPLGEDPITVKAEALDENGEPTGTVTFLTVHVNGPLRCGNDDAGDFVLCAGPHPVPLPAREDAQPSRQTPAVTGHGVLLHDLSYLGTSTDMRAEVIGMPVAVQRSFRSASRPVDGGVMGGWFFSWNQRLLPVRPAGVAADTKLSEANDQRFDLALHGGDGRVDRFVHPGATDEQTVEFTTDGAERFFVYDHAAQALVAREFSARVTEYESPRGFFATLRAYTLELEAGEHAWQRHPYWFQSGAISANELRFYELSMPDGTRYIFNCGGQLVRMIDARHHETELRYDGPVLPQSAERRLSELVDGAGRSWKVSWRLFRDGGGRLHSQIREISSPVARFVQYEYEPALAHPGMRLSAVVQNFPGQTVDGFALGSAYRARYLYDAADRLVKVIEPGREENEPYLTNVYDAAGKVTQQLLGDGGTPGPGGLDGAQWSYSQSGDEVDVQDPRGVTTTYTLSALADDGPKVITEAVMPRLVYAGPGADAAVSPSWSQEDQRWRYTHTRDGLVTTSTPPSGRVHTMAYDSFGKLLSRVIQPAPASAERPAGIVKRWTYGWQTVSLFGRPLCRMRTTESGPLDAAGNGPERSYQLATQDPSTPGLLCRHASVREAPLQDLAGGTVQFRTDYAFHETGRKRGLKQTVTTVELRGNAERQVRRLALEYDGSNITEASARAARGGRVADNRVGHLIAEVRSGSGSGDCNGQSPAQSRVEYIRDLRGNITEERVVRAGGDVVTERLFDSRDRVVRERQDPGGFAHEITRVFDERDRLVREETLRKDDFSASGALAPITGESSSRDRQRFFYDRLGRQVASFRSNAEHSGADFVLLIHDGKGNPVRELRPGPGIESADFAQVESLLLAGADAERMFQEFAPTDIDNWNASAGGVRFLETRHRYDSVGQVIEMRSLDGLAAEAVDPTELRAWARHEIVQRFYRDAEGNVALFDPGRSDRRRGEARPVVHSRYNGNGLLAEKRVLDPVACAGTSTVAIRREVAHSYNAFDKPLRTTLRGLAGRYTLAADGDLESEDCGDALLADVSYAYDAWGRQREQREKVFSVDGRFGANSSQERVTRYEMHDTGDIVATGILDAAGELSHVERFAFDHMDRLCVQSLGPDTSSAVKVIRYNHDGAGFLVRREERHLSTSRNIEIAVDYERDNIGRVSRETDGTGLSEQYFYDSLNRRRATIDRRGTLFEERYDANGRPLSQVKHAGGAQRGRRLSWAHAHLLSDARFVRDVGASADSTHGRHAWRYDMRGQVVEERVYGDAAAALPAVAQENPDMSALFSRRRLNASGQVVQEQRISGVTLDHDIDALGAIVATTVSAAPQEIRAGRTRNAQLLEKSRRFVRDARSLVTLAVNRRGTQAGEAPIASIQQRWDSLDKVREEVQRFLGGPSPAGTGALPSTSSTVRFNYDHRGWMREAVYDAEGPSPLRLGHTRDGVGRLTGLAPDDATEIDDHLDSIDYVWAGDLVINRSVHTRPANASLPSSMPLVSTFHYDERGQRYRLTHDGLPRRGTVLGGPGGVSRYENRIWFEGPDPGFIKSAQEGQRELDQVDLPLAQGTVARLAGGTVADLLEPLESYSPHTGFLWSATYTAIARDGFGSVRRSTTTDYSPLTGRPTLSFRHAQVEGTRLVNEQVQVWQPDLPGVLEGQDAKVLELRNLALTYEPEVAAGDGISRRAGLERVAIARHARLERPDGVSAGEEVDVLGGRFVGQPGQQSEVFQRRYERAGALLDDGERLDTSRSDLRSAQHLFEYDDFDRLVRATDEAEKRAVGNTGNRVATEMYVFYDAMGRRVFEAFDTLSTAPPEQPRSFLYADGEVVEEITWRYPSFDPSQPLEEANRATYVLGPAQDLPFVNLGLSYPQTNFIDPDGPDFFRIDHEEQYAVFEDLAGSYVGVFGMNDAEIRRIDARYNSRTKRQLYIDDTLAIPGPDVVSTHRVFRRVDRDAEWSPFASLTWSNEAGYYRDLRANRAADAWYHQQQFAPTVDFSRWSIAKMTIQIGLTILASVLVSNPATAPIGVALGLALAAWGAVDAGRQLGQLSYLRWDQFVEQLALEIGIEIVSGLLSAGTEPGRGLYNARAGFGAPPRTAVGRLKAARRGSHDNCFVAGTPVQTEGGLRPIESIRAGDRVWSFNESSGRFELAEVVRRFSRHGSEVLRLRVGDEVLQVTPEHPFFVEGRGFVPARQLAIGDAVRARSGARSVAEAPVPMAAGAPVFNFEVRGNHNYLVGEAGLLVHNVSQLPDPKVLIKNLESVLPSLGTRRVRDTWLLYLPHNDANFDFLRSWVPQQSLSSLNLADTIDHTMLVLWKLRRLARHNAAAAELFGRIASGETVPIFVDRLTDPDALGVARRGGDPVVLINKEAVRRASAYLRTRDKTRSADFSEDNIMMVVVAHEDVHVTQDLSGGDYAVNEIAALSRERTVHPPMQRLDYFDFTLHDTNIPYMEWQESVVMRGLEDAQRQGRARPRP